MHRPSAAAIVSGVLGAALCLGAVAAPAADASAKPRVFANCSQLNSVYPHGVGTTTARDKGTSKSFRPVTNFKRDNALYQANKKSDRDRDGIACEKH